MRDALDYSAVVSWGELTSSKLTAQSYEAVGTRDAFDCSAFVSWGGLISSKLKAQSYEEAGTRAPTTDC